jgi:hypothetical protein
MKVSLASKISPQRASIACLTKAHKNAGRWFVGTLASLLVASAMAQTVAPPPNQDDGVMSREQILALFEREAKAAYQMAKEACAALSGDEQKRCLAQARLQYDADRRYARKRADQGY